MIMKWMEVYIVARTGRPKSDNPKKTLIGLKLTEEEAARLKGYASKHDMTITQVHKQLEVPKVTIKMPPEPKVNYTFKIGRAHV